MVEKLVKELSTRSSVNLFLGLSIKLELVDVTVGLKFGCHLVDTFTQHLQLLRHLCVELYDLHQVLLQLGTL